MCAKKIVKDRTKVFEHPKLGVLRAVLLNGNVVYSLGDLCKMFELKYADVTGNTCSSSHRELDVIYPYGGQGLIYMVSLSCLYDLAYRHGGLAFNELLHWVITGIIPAFKDPYYGYTTMHFGGEFEVNSVDIDGKYIEISDDR